MLRRTRRRPPRLQLLWSVWATDVVPGLISSRALAEKIIKLEGKDCADRAMRNDMVKRVGKSLKLLRQRGLAHMRRDPNGGSVWASE